MLWGFFKKMVIADRIGLLVSHVYSNISGTNGISVIIATILFAYQIYCDFSGYSDIAVGTALIFGYDLVNNFDRPYASRSMRNCGKDGTSRSPAGSKIIFTIRWLSPARK